MCQSRWSSVSQRPFAEYSSRDSARPPAAPGYSSAGSGVNAMEVSSRLPPMIRCSWRWMHLHPLMMIVSLCAQASTQPQHHSSSESLLASPHQGETGSSFQVIYPLFQDSVFLLQPAGTCSPKWPSSNTDLSYQTIYAKILCSLSASLYPLCIQETSPESVLWTRGKQSPCDDAV